MINRPEAMTTPQVFHCFMSLSWTIGRGRECPWLRQRSRQLGVGFTVEANLATASDRTANGAFAGSLLADNRPGANFTSADSTPSSPLSRVSILSTQLGQENSSERRVVVFRVEVVMVVCSVMVKS